MHLPLPMDHQTPANTPAIVRVLTRDDIVWNRPMFKAPPLDVVPPIADISELVRAIRRPEALAS